MAQKKVQTTGLVKERVALVENIAGRLSVRQQCELMGIARGAYYYEPRPERAANLAMMRLVESLRAGVALEQHAGGSLLCVGLKVNPPQFREQFDCCG